MLENIHIVPQFYLNGCENFLRTQLIVSKCPSKLRQLGSMPWHLHRDEDRGADSLATDRALPTMYFFRGRWLEFLYGSILGCVKVRRERLMCQIKKKRLDRKAPEDITPKFENSESLNAERKFSVFSEFRKPGRISQPTEICFGKHKYMPP